MIEGGGAWDVCDLSIVKFSLYYIISHVCICSFHWNFLSRVFDFLFCFLFMFLASLYLHGGFVSQGVLSLFYELCTLLLRVCYTTGTQCLWCGEIMWWCFLDDFYFSVIIEIFMMLGILYDRWIILSYYVNKWFDSTTTWGWWRWRCPSRVLPFGGDLGYHILPICVGWDFWSGISFKSCVCPYPFITFHIL